MTDELHEIAAKLKREGMRCNCDLDNWEPERATGHSWVCRIHKAAINADLAAYRKAKEQSNDIALR